MDDLISRQETIDALDCINGVEEVLRSIPPAEPKRGKWTLKSYRWECDQCGCLIRRNPFKGNKWNYNYCPNCGAKMEVTE